MYGNLKGHRYDTAAISTTVSSGTESATIRLAVPKLTLPVVELTARKKQHDLSELLHTLFIFRTCTYINFTVSFDFMKWA